MAINRDTLITFEGISPKVADSCFVAPSSWIIGDVTIAEGCGVFFGVSIRGDIQPIRIGRASNIQENAVLHTSRGRNPLVIGDEVTVGHAAILHGCKILGRAIIGMGSTVLDDAVIEEDCILGANSLVPEGKIIPKGSLAFGSPAKVIRTLSPEEILSIKQSADAYALKAQQYKVIFSN